MKIQFIVVKVGTTKEPTTIGDQEAVLETFSNRLQEQFPNTPIQVVPEHTSIKIDGNEYAPK
jgi:hypothetical protein